MSTLSMTLELKKSPKSEARGGLTELLLAFRQWTPCGKKLRQSQAAESSQQPISKQAPQFPARA